MANAGNTTLQITLIWWWPVRSVGSIEALTTIGQLRLLEHSSRMGNDRKPMGIFFWRALRRTTQQRCALIHSFFFSFFDLRYLLMADLLVWSLNILNDVDVVFVLFMLNDVFNWEKVPCNERINKAVLVLGRKGDYLWTQEILLWNHFDIKQKQ